VGFLALCAGLLLPWLGGTLWLVFVECKFTNSNKINRFRQVGYGFFLGYAVLFLAIMAANKLTGTVSWSGVMLFLLFFALSGGIAVWQSRTPGSKLPLVAHAATSTAMKICMVIILVLMSIHLVFIGLEIFTQAVYPWDAWLVWVYRAKAWFSADSISAVASTSDWAMATTADVYTIDAWRYPLFPSIIPYWAALSLGEWSETLVSLPVLFAGTAIGMALYGQCREHGFSIAISLIICYLLFSIPLFGTHLALAGYADIWMAGFTGLGFIALMQGAIKQGETSNSRAQIILGFLMITFSILVKNEGAVWFLAALAMMVLATCRLRTHILILVIGSLLVLLGFALGVTYIEIPLIGQFGIIDDRLAIPFIGKFQLEIHDVRYAYWDNFFKMGSWNLLWLAVATSLLLGFRRPDTSQGHRTRRAVLSFILIFFATQLFIFGVTNQGLWADTYTAVNRLPLHFTPALLFAVAVIASASLARRKINNIAMENSNGEV
jgi:hypothetical protein